MNTLQYGCDRLAAYAPLYRSARAALLTGPTGRGAYGVPGGGRSTIQTVAKLCDLRLLLAPEHGVRGDSPAGAAVAESVDAVTGLPVHSLYGSTKRLTPELLEQFDVLFYDMQDVGSRYYTFLSTLLYVLEDCAAAHKAVVVLDRPDPLGGTVLEGNLPAADALSFVGCYSMPNRYGMTVGEFAAMANAERGLHCELTVVPCAGWRREMLFPDWGQPWIMPSLNLPGFEAALLYVGTCLLEGTNVSEGRGTAAPFQLLGAPYIRDAEALADAFNALGLPGLLATPYYFMPTTSKHQGELCGGIRLHVTDARAARPLEAGLRLLDLLRTLYPQDFALLPPHRAGGRPFLSLLAGHRELERRRWHIDDLLAQCHADEAAFATRRQKYLLYA